MADNTSEIDPVMLKAERDGLASLLLDVQQECIRLRKALAHLRQRDCDGAMMKERLRIIDDALGK